MPENHLNPNLQRDLAGGSVPGALEGTPWARVGVQTVPRSLAEVAQRDLDAALQLLADRAQYITGATGAAIALRREGRNDMLCRASTGSSAPELGALLSTEYGLSGESVRTRQLMRCDDAERDTRVNREVCRRLGIASVVVMPVVNDDGVLGVFELFSGTAHAFGERDVSAVQRLSAMVETAVRVARVTENFPEQLKAVIVPPVEEKILDDSADLPRASADREASDEEIIDVDLADPAPPMLAKTGEVKPQEASTIPVPAIPTAETAANARPAEITSAVPVQAPNESASEGPRTGIAPSPEKPAVAQKATPTLPVSAITEAPAPAKPLFWSAAQQESEEKAAAKDQSHVPPVLRGLRKCDACGFPISEGRVLCVECEEKKWRGQLKRPMPTGGVAGSAPARKPAAQAFAAAQSAGAGVSVMPNSRVFPPPRKNDETPGMANVAVRMPSVSPIGPKPLMVDRAPAKNTTVQAAPEFLASPEALAPVLSAGLESSQPWFSRYKYILLVLLLVAGLVAALVFR